MPAGAPDPWVALRRVGQPACVPAGVELARQGSPGDCLFVLDSGRLEVIRRVPGDAEEPVDLLHPGAIFGEMAVLDGGVRSATLRTIASSEVWRISRPAFDYLALQGGTDGLAVLVAILQSLDARVFAVRSALGGAAMEPAVAICSSHLHWQPWHPRTHAITALAPLANMDFAPRSELLPAIECVELASGTRIRTTAPDPHLLMLASGALTLDSNGRCNLPVHGPGQFLDACGVGAATRWRVRSKALLLRLPNPDRSPAPGWAAPLLLALARDRAGLLRRSTGRLMHARTSAALCSNAAARWQRPTLVCNTSSTREPRSSP